MELSALFAACLLIRLIPFRPPNIEPLLAMQMPFAKAYGKSVGFIFAFFGMILFDILTGKVGGWTFITAFIYGLLGVWAAVYFKNKTNSPFNYALFAVVATLFFDAGTGLTIGPLFFHQSFLVALTGQLPFTLWHLLGNVSFALVLSPAIYSLTTRKRKKEAAALISTLSPKII